MVPLNYYENVTGLKKTVPGVHLHCGNLKISSEYFTHLMECVWKKCEHIAD